MHNLTDYTHKRKINKVAIKANNRIIGYVKGCTFYKKIRGSIHIMRVPNAIFFSVDSLQDAEKVGAVYVHITDKETGDIFHAPISKIWERGIRREYADYGEQIGLMLYEFNSIETITEVSGHNETVTALPEYEQGRLL